MKPLRASLALGLLFLLAPAAGGSEELRVTLREALALVETANPEILALAARAQAQEARAESTRRMSWPRLHLSMGWSHLDLPAGVFANKLNAGQFGAGDFDLARLNDPDAVSHLGTTLALEAPLDAFGRVRRTAEAQTAQGDAMAASTRDALQEVRLRVVETYLRADLAERALEVTGQVLAVARAREAEIQARVDTGAALTADLLRARARRRAREADLAERKGQRQTALAGLARLLGAPAGTGYVPSEPPPVVTSLEGEEEAWVTRALGQRAALVSAARRADAASSLAKAEKSARWPELGIYGQLHDNRLSASDGAQAWAVGAGLRWTPFDATRGRREAAALAEQRAAEHDRRAGADQVRLEVATAYRRGVSARERHAAAAGGAEEGREALRVVRERRHAGLATLTDELETEVEALGAALAEIGAAAEVAMADAALRRAAGEN